MYRLWRVQMVLPCLVSRIRAKSHSIYDSCLIVDQCLLSFFFLLYSQDPIVGETVPLVGGRRLMKKKKQLYTHNK